MQSEEWGQWKTKIYTIGVQWRSPATAPAKAHRDVERCGEGKCNRIFKSPQGCVVSSY